MNKPISPAAVSGLRQRFIEDMTVRGFTEKPRRLYRRYYIRIVSGFAAFLDRSPDTATAEDIRRFQVHQSELGMHAPAMNSTVAALRFFFTHTLDRPALSRKLIRLRYPHDRSGWRHLAGRHALGVVAAWLSAAGASAVQTVPPPALDAAA